MANPFATSVNRFSDVVIHEYEPSTGFCREAITANEATAKSYVPGTALGKVITGGTATAVANAGNTGDGAMGAITVAAPAKVGVYSLTMIAAATNAGTFVVTDPDGQVVGSGTVAVEFDAGGLTFTLADGATDFAVGDSFLITVVGTFKYKIAVETATDGSDAVVAIVLEEKSVAATTDTTVLAMTKGPAQLKKAGIALDATFDSDAKKLVAYNQLTALGMEVLTSV